MESITCAYCGESNKITDKFCRSCGAPLHEKVAVREEQNSSDEVKDQTSSFESNQSEKKEEGNVVIDAKYKEKKEKKKSRLSYKAYFIISILTYTLFLLILIDFIHPFFSIYSIEFAPGVVIPFTVFAYVLLMILSAISLGRLNHAISNELTAIFVYSLIHLLTFGLEFAVSYMLSTGDLPEFLPTALGYVDLALTIGLAVFLTINFLMSLIRGSGSLLGLPLQGALTLLSFIPATLSISSLSTDFNTILNIYNILHPMQIVFVWILIVDIGAILFFLLFSLIFNKAIFFIRPIRLRYLRQNKKEE